MKFPFTPHFGKHVPSVITPFPKQNKGKMLQDLINENHARGWENEYVSSVNINIRSVSPFAPNKYEKRKRREDSSFRGGNPSAKGGKLVETHIYSKSVVITRNNRGKQ